MSKAVAEVTAETLNETVFKKVWPAIRKLDSVDPASDSISFDRVELNSGGGIPDALHVNVKTVARYHENAGAPNLLKKAWERALEEAGLEFKTKESEHAGTQYAIPLSIDGATQEKLETLAAALQGETQKMKGGRRASR